MISQEWIVLHRQRSRPFPISRHTANVAPVIVGIVLTFRRVDLLPGRQRLESSPLGQQRVIAKCANESGAILAKLFGVRRWLMTQQFREKRRVSTLRPAVEDARQCQIAVQPTKKTVYRTARRARIAAECAIRTRTWRCGDRTIDVAVWMWTRNIVSVKK